MSDYNREFILTIMNFHSAKLLGFICELVESSQTVQQHMIQVSINRNNDIQLLMFDIFDRIEDFWLFRSCYKDHHVII